MIINSDWHIHSDASYDSKLSFAEILGAMGKYGFSKMGITDHVNSNAPNYMADLAKSATTVAEARKINPNIYLGVEVTPLDLPEYEYILKNGTREGYTEPETDTPFDLALPLTKEEIEKFGIRYVIGAAHWRMDIIQGKPYDESVEATIAEWHRLQMWLLNDERITVLGHPWWNGKGLWYEDFSIIPKWMNEEMGAKLKESGKLVECNAGILASPKASEKFKHQYAEFIREYFEMGIPVVYGSDAHNEYKGKHVEIEKYLVAAGFKPGDFSEVI